MREGDLLRHIYAFNDRLGGAVIVPPGDDMAVTRIGGAVVLSTVDQLADGVHVDLRRDPLELIGRKAITRNLSDVAAMAAKPVGALVAAALPRGFGEDRANALFDAMRAAAERYACPLIGGDITMWDNPLMLTVTVLAEPAGVEPVLRRGAKPGDIVCVSGELGAAWSADGSRSQHLTFEPRIDLARRLAQTVALHAMIDLSDGLATDLAHIAEQSNVAAEIDGDAVPCRTDLAAAFNDGEDYELCFTLAPADADRLGATVNGVTITRIGRIMNPDESPPDGRIWLIRGDGRREPMAKGGWEHRGTTT